MLYKEYMVMSGRANGRTRQWNEYFMKIAESVATMATCDRLHVGCVLVKDNRIIATGFNGSISKHDHCDDVGHLYNGEGRCIRTIHAEQNAIIQCAKHGISTDGAVAYVTHQPCENCTKFLAQSGIKKVYYRHSYDNKYAKEFAKGVEMIHLTESAEELYRSISPQSIVDDIIKTRKEGN